MENSEDGGSEHAALLHAAFDVKGIKRAALKLDGCLHVDVVVEWSDQAV